MGLARKTGQLLIWSLLAVSSQAATVTDSGTKSDTAQATSYTSNAFTPAAGDLLVVFVAASGTGDPGTMTDSQGLGFTKIASTGYFSNANTVYVFVSNSFASASSMTVTFHCTGDSATGCVIQVARVSGMSRTGASAVLQSAVAHAPGGTTPAATFAAAVQTGNPTLGLVGNASNPAALTPPTSWTEHDDTGYITPPTGAEYVSRNSGFTGTTITWGAASASAHGEVIVEFQKSSQLFIGVHNETLSIVAVRVSNPDRPALTIQS
jgi:hypothetical protein